MMSKINAFVVACITVLVALVFGVFVFLSTPAQAGAPSATGVSSTPAPWDQSGLQSSASVCTTVSSAATVDVDGLFSALSAGERNQIRAIQVTYADSVNTGPICFAVGQTTLTCNPAAGGTAAGLLLGYGSTVRYLLRERSSPDLPEMVAKSSTASAKVICFEVFK